MFFSLFKLFFAVGGTSILHFGSRVSSTWLLYLRTTSGIRASQVRRGIIWWFKGHLLLIWWRSCVDLRSALGLCGIVCRSQNSAWSAQGINWGVDLFRNSSRVSWGGKDLIFIKVVYLTPFGFPHYIEDLVKEMAEESTSVRTMNPHPRIWNHLEGGE